MPRWRGARCSYTAIKRQEWRGIFFGLKDLGLWNEVPIQFFPQAVRLEVPTALTLDGWGTVTSNPGREKQASLFSSSSPCGASDKETRGLGEPPILSLSVISLEIER